MDDIFRSFFNLPPRDHSGRRESPEWNDDVENTLENFGTSFNVFFPHDMFKQMEEMVSSMEQVMKFGDQQQFSIEAVPHGNDEESKISPRDQMLKDEKEKQRFSGSLGRNPWSRVWERIPQPSQKEDQDLDSMAQNAADLERFLSQDERPSNSTDLESLHKQPRRHWSSSSFSSVTVRGADGTYEKKEMRRDGEGNTETVTRKSVEGQTCTERVTTDARGRVVDQWSDCTEELLHRKPLIKGGKPARPSVSTNSDDGSVFKNIFGSDLPPESNR